MECIACRKEPTMTDAEMPTLLAELPKFRRYVSSSPTWSLPFGRTVIRADAGEQRHLTSSFDRNCDEALVSAAGAGLVARADLPSIGEITTK
jgi:hypothetical protein